MVNVWHRDPRRSGWRCRSIGHRPLRFRPARSLPAITEAGFEVRLEKSYGRMFSWGYWLSRLRNYPRPVYKAIEAVIEGLDIKDKLLYLDTRDSMEICARRIA